MFDQRPFKNPTKHKLSFSILFSIAVHMGALFFLNKHLQHYFSPLDALMSEHHKQKEVTSYQRFFQKENILPIVFEETSENKTTSSKEISPEVKLSFYEKTISISKEPKIKHKKIKESDDFAWKNSFEKKTLQGKNFLGIQATLPSLAKTDITGMLKELDSKSQCFQNSQKKEIKQIKENLKILPKMEKNKKFSLPYEHEKLFAMTCPIPSTNMMPIHRSNFTKNTQLQPTFVRLDKTNRLVSPLLSRLPTLQDLSTLSISKDFDIELVYTKRDDAPGYIFALTLLPNPLREFKKIPQNIIFLIDRSNYIEKERLFQARRAIVGAISVMDSKDRFNILAFDNNLELLSDQNLPINDDSSYEAKDFLVNQKLGSFFSSTNLGLPLKWLLTQKNNESQINVAIYLTNGSDLQEFKNRQLFDKWSRNNHGAISLYTLSLNDDSNLGILDFYSAKNKGKLLTASTHHGIKRHLQRLIHSLRYPIAKDLSANAISFDKETLVHLYPEDHKLPNLYLNKPYVILGTINNLQDFILFLQGRHANDWFNIKKVISFKDAKKGSIALKKQWAIQRAYRCYERYQIDGKKLHIEEAEKILKPFHLDVAFE